MSQPRPLVATYRLQLRVDRDLRDAKAALDHLVELGISHLYLAPILQARDGSTHGYDVVDTSRVDPALGGDTALDELVAAAHERGIGLVVDIVPNHMAADPDRNPWWRDVLRHGQASRYADHFDISWDPPDRKLRDQVLVPVLGDHYGRVLDRGELQIERQPSELAVRYHERTFPLALPSCLPILREAASAAPSAQLDLVLRSLDHLVPGADDVTTDAVADRAILESAASVVAECLEDPAVAAAVDAAIDATNADRQRLHQALDAQHYRLARWRTGTDELGYRRFFDVTELVAVRVERPDVFRDTHARVARWVGDGLIDGLRVDHPDGLADPAGYFEDLRRLAGDRWIVAEKILEADEVLPPWPVDGTTGYEFAAAVGRLFIEPAGYATIADHAASVGGAEPDVTHVIREAKAEVLEHGLAAELRRLTHELVVVCEAHLDLRDFTRRELREALVVSLASLPVYRTYVTADGQPSAQDRAMVARMVHDATAWRPDIEPDLLAMIGASVVGDRPFDGSPSAAFRQRFQQLSGAVMAKGKEDTALYRSLVVGAVNEVGAEPAHPAAGPAELHEQLRASAERTPTTMLTLSTHDTKRSDDVRARLAVLSEVPDRYLDALDRFGAIAATAAGSELDLLAVTTIFQALVGAHPLSSERLGAYVEKALREAGVRTSWLEVDEAYEEQVQSTIRTVTADPEAMEIVSGLVDDILVDGRVSSLAQRLLLLTAPGVPDVYQGSELWDLSLVDPDNRRPIDLEATAELLVTGGWTAEGTAVPGWSELRDPTDPGTPKLALTARALTVRRAHPRAFAPGAEHRPLAVDGPGADHVVAYARADEVVVVVPRLGRTLRDRGGWAGTAMELPPGTWHDALSPGRSWSGRLEADAAFDRLPVALLHRAGEDDR